MEEKKERGRGGRKTYRTEEVSTQHLYEYDKHCSCSHLFPSYALFPLLLIFFLNNSPFMSMSFLFLSEFLTWEKMYICLGMWSVLLSTMIPVPPIFLQTAFSSPLCLREIPLARVFFTHPSSGGWFHCSAIVLLQEP